VTVYVYKVLLLESEEVYWLDDPSDIVPSFGRVIEVTRYCLTNPTDLTDEVNGEYLREDD
jgi:hypothetical protein